MFINFMDRCYEVLQKIKTTSVLDLYVAKDLKEDGQQTYTVVCIHDQELARKLIPITTKKNTSIAFKDLHESFNLEEKYYIVFHHAEGETLQQAMQENLYGLRERLLLMKNILEQIFLMNMPECFIYEVLRKDNIVVDEYLAVRFNYSFTEVDYYWQVNGKECLRRISGLVQELFQEELAERSIRELSEFSRDLEEEEFEDIWECYEAYNEVYDAWIWQAEQQEIRTGRFRWKAWEFLKRKFPVMRAALAILLILALGAYLLLNLPNPALSEDGIAFEKIGTLDIQTPSDAEASQTPSDTSGVQTPGDAPNVPQLEDSADPQSPEDGAGTVYPDDSSGTPLPNIQYPDDSSGTPPPNIQYPDDSTGEPSLNIRYPDNSTGTSPDSGSDSPDSSQGSGGGYPSDIV